MSDAPTSQRRVAKHEPDELDGEQRRLYESIVGGLRSQGPQAFTLVDDRGRLEGPFDAMLHRPVLGAALQKLGAVLRYRSGLTDRCREIAILTAAYHWKSDFEIYAHEPLGRSAGLSEDELAGLRAGAVDTFTDPVERSVAATAATLAADGDLDDRDFAGAEAALGSAGLFELTALVGYYATLALQMRVFRVARPG